MDDEELTLEQKKVYVCRNSRRLNRIDVKDVGKMLVRMGLRSYLKFSGEGAHIDLDRLAIKDPNLITQIHSQIKHKLTKITK